MDAKGKKISVKLLATDFSIKNVLLFMDELFAVIKYFSTYYIQAFILVFSTLDGEITRQEKIITHSISRYVFATADAQ